MKINYFNPEHAHTLIDLPTRMTIEEAVKLLKGGSSHWINEQLVRESIIKGKSSLRNTSYLESGMACSGARQETIETVS